MALVGVHENRGRQMVVPICRAAVPCNHNLQNNIIVIEAKQICNYKLNLYKYRLEIA